MCSRGMGSENRCKAVEKERKPMQKFCKTML